MKQEPCDFSRGRFSIWDEYQYGKCVYNDGQVKTKRWQNNELKCLIKYMVNEGYTLKDIRSSLIKCCNDDIRYLTKKQITNIFNKLVQQAKKEPIIKDKKVIIYQSEIDKIKSLENKNLEQILFILLVYRKWVGDGNLDWFAILKSDILKESKVLGINHTVFQGMLSELYNCGFIDSDVKIVEKKYRNKNKDTKKQEWKVNILEIDGDIAFEISNYINIVYRYLDYVYGGYFECSQCGGMFLKKTNNQKYCELCAKSVQSKQKQEWDKLNR